jgi:hypothetical protein
MVFVHSIVTCKRAEEVQKKKKKMHAENNKNEKKYTKRTKKIAKRTDNVLSPSSIPCPLSSPTQRSEKQLFVLAEIWGVLFPENGSRELKKSFSFRVFLLQFLSFLWLFPDLIHQLSFCNTHNTPHTHNLFRTRKKSPHFLFTFLSHSKGNIFLSPLFTPTHA